MNSLRGTRGCVICGENVFGFVKLKFPRNWLTFLFGLPNTRYKLTYVVRVYDGENQDRSSFTFSDSLKRRGWIPVPYCDQL